MGGGDWFLLLPLAKRAGRLPRLPGWAEFEMEYKNTLNLPQTDFPMRAGLVQREPERLAKWYAEGLYEQIQKRREGAERFLLHDGPPFANGDVHIGTALNKILKDFILKYQSLRGKHVPYVPGWDCHGLPIEFKVTQQMRKAGNTDATSAAIRKACEEYALGFIDKQREQFKRLGILGEWDKPYLTLNPEYEAEELRLFADLVEKGFVYRGKKPVYWSIPCRTALAEAEVEYQDHVSQSVYVKFPIVGETNMHLLIWTTTPWTLPANLAVAYNSQFDYQLIRVGEEALLVSVPLLDTVVEKCGWAGDFEILRTVQGDQLEEFEYHHPFCDRTGKLFAGDLFVDDSAGTGLVHIAPGHGQDDYNLGRNNGLPIYSPVDDSGCLARTADLPEEQQISDELVGKQILPKNGKSEANEAVIEVLKAGDKLAFEERYEHSYPHCWRSKTPVIFRAMDQWFVNIDHDGFRDQALAAIDSVNWVPGWGRKRIEGAVQSRPDWCISRQRSWGLPIPAFYDPQGEPILDARIVRNTANLVKEQGSNVWYESDLADLWAAVKPTDWDGPEVAGKSTDTLDVWIDSGSSSRSVLMQRSELGRPDAEDGTPDAWQADYYLEGSDQHRGWFQSSLLLSLAGNGVAPYRNVLTHGFMVDADREKISKSKQDGGYTKPQTAEAYVGEYGADIVRLWVASQDFRNDITVSEERIKKVAEAYRGIRNALRYQLSNLYDFDPSQHTVADDELTGLDRWILDAFAKLDAEVRGAFDACEFHAAYQRITQFVSVELSAVYHDTVKDRLYTSSANSPRRRSTQTALYRLIQSFCKMLSPMLAFTADEAWEAIPHLDNGSVHLADWEPFEFSISDDEVANWQTLFAIRERALPVLEEARQAKRIGKGLEASLTLVGVGRELQISRSNHEDLRELLNVSQLILNEGKADKLQSVVAKADGKKCERCWRWETSVGAHKEHPTLCTRCVEAVS